MKPKIAIRKKFAKKIKEQDQRKAAKLKRDANYKAFGTTVLEKKKRVKAPTHRVMGKPPRDLSTRAEFFKDCKPSEVHQRKLEYQEYCEEILEHPKRITVVGDHIQCAECGKVIK